MASTASNDIILYDIPSREPRQAWSLNTIRTRMVLSYKSIPYTTQWVEYPDIAALLEGHVTPNGPDQIAPYTLPAIRLPDGEYVMGSLNIAKHLSAEHPDPLLQLVDDSPYHKKVIDFLVPFWDAVEPVYIPGVARDLLPRRSAEYFNRTREPIVGQPLLEFEKCERGGENAWKAAEPQLLGLSALYRENGGPFLAGKEPVYTDFIVVAIVRMMDRLGKLDKIKSYGGEDVVKAFEAAKKWWERDDH